MSNIGKIKIVLPPVLDIQVCGWKILVKGPFGERVFRTPPYTRVVKEHGLLSLQPFFLDSRSFGSLQRQLRAFLYGMAYLYVKRLVFVGVGYRARQEENKILLRLGFSHEISLSIPSTLDLKIVKRSNLILKGNNFDELSHFAYRLRSFRRPEPFKGKGIHCLGEFVRRKEGKKKKV